MEEKPKCLLFCNVEFAYEVSIYFLILIFLSYIYPAHILILLFSSLLTCHFLIQYLQLQFTKFPISSLISSFTLCLLSLLLFHFFFTMMPLSFAHLEMLETIADAPDLIHEIFQ